MTDAVDPELDLEHAQYAGPRPEQQQCRTCAQPLVGAYYSLNGRAICEPCLRKGELGQRGSFIRALAFGTVAGALGAGVYYGIRSLTGYDLALVTIVLGLMVGIAVRMGAGASKAIGYRVLAVVLTWIAMCTTYVPSILQSASDDPDAPVTAGVLAVSTVLSMVVPYFLLAEAEVLGLLIFGFGLWQAWRSSAPRPFAVEGPFEAIAPASTASDAQPEPAGSGTSVVGS